MHNFGSNNVKVGQSIKNMSIGKKIKNNFLLVLIKPELLFVALSLTFGLIMVFVMPPFTAPDETSHFARAYQVSQGVLVGTTINGETGGYLPFNNDLNNCTSILTMSKCPDLNQKVDLNETAFVRVSASAYSPIVYIPQMVGIDIGKVAYPSIYVLSTLGRIFNLLAYTLMFYVAIRIARFGEWVYVVVGLFPVAIQQAASLSGDVMTIGLCVIWIAIIGNLFLSSDKIDKRQSIVLILLAIGLALTKQTDIILAASVLLLPKRVFNNTKQKVLFIIAVLFTALLAVGLWSLVLHNIHFTYSYYLGDTVSQAGQLKAMLHHPSTFIVALFHEYVFEGFHSNGVSPDFLITSLHSVFSSFSYKLPLLFCILGYVGLLVALLHNDRYETAVNKFKMNRLAIAQTIAFLLSLLAIAGALYLNWSPVGSRFIYGVQGRYFLPVIPLLIPIFMVAKRYISVNMKGKYTMGIVTGLILSINLLFTIILTIRFFHS